MSRMERHKDRREGNIKSLDSEELKNDIAQGYDINPITSEKSELKRKKIYANPIIIKDLEVEKTTETAVGKKEELFDIEEVFKELERNFRAPDYDTQVEIMQELINNKAINRLSDLEHPANEKAIYKDENTNQILISENELNNILINKEKEYQKQLSLKKTWQKRKPAPASNSLGREAKIKEKKNKQKPAIKKEKYKIDPLTIILGVILLILLIILIWLVITFFN